MGLFVSLSALSTRQHAHTWLMFRVLLGSFFLPSPPRACVLLARFQHEPYARLRLRRPGLSRRRSPRCEVMLSVDESSVFV